MKRCKKAGLMDRPTIFMVEDHKTFRHTLRDWLITCFEECRFMEAGSGEEAVALAAGEPPDVVLMDIGLPGMDGIQATRRIKETAPQAQVVVLTMHEGPEYEAAAAAAGACAFISKRTVVTDLVPVLERLMAAVRTEDAPLADASGHSGDTLPI